MQGFRMAIVVPMLFVTAILVITGCSDDKGNNGNNSQTTEIESGVYQLVQFVLGCDTISLPVPACDSATTQFISVDNANKRFCVVERNSLDELVYVDCQSDSDVPSPGGIPGTIAQRGDSLFMSLGNCGDVFSFLATYVRISPTPLILVDKECGS